MRRATHPLRRALSALLVTLLFVSLVPVPSAFAAEKPMLTLANQVPAEFGATPERVYGPDRYQTAIAISQEAWTSSEYVLLATGQGWADALIANPLAAALGAPILLTPSDSLSTAVWNEIDRLGATKIIVLGGESAVSGQVITDLVSRGISIGNIERLGGRDRYDTAVRVAERVMIYRGRPDNVVIATGQSYPDALAIAGFAARGGYPILLTEPGNLPAATSRELDVINPSGAVVVGGTSAVSSNVASRLPNPSRIGGETRYDTARLIAEFAFANGFTYESVVLSTGEGYADALAAGPWVAKMQGMLVLTDKDTLSTETDEFFNDHCSSIKNIYVAGGTAAVAADVVDDVEEAASSKMNADEIEVVSAAAESALETMSPNGDIVFDDTVDYSSINTSDVLLGKPSAGAPNGYLRRVLNVYEAGGKVTVETTEATLADVIQKGSIDVTGTVPQDVPEVGSGLTMTEATAIDSTHVDVDFGTMQMQGSRVDPAVTIGRASYSYNRVLYEKDNLELRAQGNLDVSASFTISASFGIIKWNKAWWGWWPSYGLKEFKATAYLNESMSVKLLSELTLVDFEKEIELTRIKLPTVTVWAGPVPIVFVNSLTPIVGVSASLGANLEVGVNQWARCSFGVRYNRWSGWSPIKSFRSGYGFTVEGAVEANAKAWLGARLDIQLYGAAGPYFQPQAFLEFDASTAANPWWTLDAGLEAEFGGRINILGKRASVGWSYELYRRRLASAPGAFPSMQEAAAMDPVRGEVPVSGSMGDDELSYEPASMQMPAATSGAIVADSVDTSDFTIDGLTVTDAVVLDADTIRLTTTPQTKGTSYNVLVEDESIVNDSGAKVMASNDGFVGYWPVTVSDVSAVDATTVDVLFDSYSELDTSTVTADDFSIDGLTVTTVTVQPDGRTVRLTTMAQPWYRTFDLDTLVDTIEDEEGFANLASTDSLETYTLPAIEYVHPIDPTTLDVVWGTFSRIDTATVATGDFSIPGLTVSAAQIQPDGKTVRLTTSNQTAGDPYVLTCSAGVVTDATGASVETTDPITGYSSYTAAATTVNPANKSIYVIRGITDQIAYGTGHSGSSFKTTDGGGTWTNIGAASWNSYDLTFPDPSNPNLVMVSSYGGHLNRSTNGGASWADMNLSAYIGHCEGIDFAGSTGKGLAVDGAFIVKSSNFGATWTEHPQAGTGLVATAIRFANDTRGYIGGTSGRMWRSDDSGDTWTQLSTPAAAVTIADIWTSADDPDHVIAVGASGYILVSFNGGETWQTPTSGVSMNLSDIDFATSDVGFAVGSGPTILVTRDGGRSWNGIMLGGNASSFFSGVWARDANNVWVGGLNGLARKVTGN